MCVSLSKMRKCYDELIKSYYPFFRVPCKAPEMSTLSSGYQPGVTQPYSKWNTDMDEVQVDYDQLTAQKRHRYGGD